MPRRSRTTRTETVRYKLEDEIISGQLPPGSRLDEDAIASRFGVSRTPIREAVFQLVQSGLIEKKARHGLVVRRLDLEQMIQLFDFGSELAGISAKMAARRMSPHDLNELRKLHAEAGRALAQSNVDDYWNAVELFHNSIIDFCGNSFLIAQIRNVTFRRLTPFFHYRLHDLGRMAKDHAEHAEMLAAFDTRDADAVATMMRQHGVIEMDVLVDYVSRDRAQPARHQYSAETPPEPQRKQRKK